MTNKCLVYFCINYTIQILEWPSEHGDLMLYMEDVISEENYKGHGLYIIEYTIEDDEIKPTGFRYLNDQELENLKNHKRVIS